MLEINPNAVSVWISLQHYDCDWLNRVLLRRHAGAVTWHLIGCLNNVFIHHCQSTYV